MLPALVACFILTGIHAYLGIHVVERKVIFVDLSLAQVAALGAVIASLFKMDIHGNGAYLMALSFTFIGAAVFSLTRTRDDKIPQEAIIGIVYAVSTSLAILLLSKSAEAAEHLQEMLVGNILFVSWADNLKILILYGIIGFFHIVFRKQFVMVSFALNDAIERKLKVKIWDFLFYITFGFVVTSSVRIAGVLLVFSFLVVPSVCGVMFAGSIWKRLLVGWTVGLLTSCLGIFASLRYDFPTGASIVCAFGLMLVFLVPVKILVSKNRKLMFFYLLAMFIGLFMVAKPFSERHAETKKTETIGDNAHFIGDRIEIDSVVLTLHSIRIENDSQVKSSEEGENKDYFVDVTLENSSTDTIPYNSSNFELKGGEDDSYTPELFPEKEPSFENGKIEPGKSVRGWITYKIPIHKNIEEVVFTPQWTENRHVVIFTRK